MGASCRVSLCSQESPHTSCGKYVGILFRWHSKRFTIYLTVICAFVFALQECAHRFPVPLYGNDGRKQDKFILTVPQDQLKCVVTLTGDSISHAVSVTMQMCQYLMHSSD